MLTRSGMILFGAGGHAMVVFDALQALLDGREGFALIDDNPSLVNQDFFGIRIQSAEICKLFLEFRFHVAIGSNNVRRLVFDRLRKQGGLPFSVVHPQACVSSRALVEDGSFFAAGSIVAASSTICAGAIINHAAVVDHECYIGEYSHIAPNATLGGQVKIGAGVIVGAGAVVLPGVSIDDGATIGAGAVVIADVPKSATVIGVPGRISKRNY